MIKGAQSSNCTPETDVSLNYVTLFYMTHYKKSKLVFQVKESHSREAIKYFILAWAVSIHTLCYFFQTAISTFEKCDPTNTESVIRLVKPRLIVFPSQGHMKYWHVHRVILCNHMV